MHSAPILLSLIIVAGIATGAEDTLTLVNTFLSQRQEADGSWNDQTWPEPTQKEVAGRPITPASPLLTTSLAIQVQALTGQQQSASRGLIWLRTQQAKDGSIGATNTEQAIATQAFLEGWYLGDDACEESARLGLQMILKRRICYLGWAEQLDERAVIDTDTSFWCQFTTRDNESDLQLLNLGRELIRSAWHARNNYRISIPQSDDGRTLIPTTYPARVHLGPQGGFSLDFRTADAAPGGLYLMDRASFGWEEGGDALRTLANRVTNDLAIADGVAPYWHQRFISLNAFPDSISPPVVRPNRKHWDILLNQGFHRDGALAGSWDPHPDRPADGGRITTTCFAALTTWRVRIPISPTTSRINGALEFLRRGQEADGRWSVIAWNMRCPVGKSDQETSPESLSDLAVTSLATLAFFGAGYDHKTPNKFKKTVASALAWIIARQDTDGRWPGSVSDHATAVRALTEAWAMTNDEVLQKPAQRGITSLLERRRRLGPTGLAAWPSDDTENDFDTWATLLAIMAMRSADSGNLALGDGFAEADRWWESALHARLLTEKPDGAGLFPSHLALDGSLPKDAKLDDLFAGALAGLLLGHPADHPAISTLTRAGLTWEAAQIAQELWDPRKRWIASLTLSKRGRHQSGALSWRRWMVINQSIDVQVADSECSRGGLPTAKRNATRLDLLSATLYGVLAEEAFQYHLRLRDGER